MKLYPLTLLLLCSFLHSTAQGYDIAPYIEAWTVSDTSQTHKSAVFFDKLDEKKDTVAFFKTVAALKEHLSNHPSRRLEARILMFEVFGAMVFRWEDEKYQRMLERAMEIAHELKDDQLMSEIYVYYAEITGKTNHLLYNLKAIEIQERIGFQHFYTAHNRFFIVSNALYHNREYRQSIDYGLRCLSFLQTDEAHWLRLVYILQLDILGAAYKKIGILDSAIYYYLKIQDTLLRKEDTSAYQQLWLGIARGNIGHCLALQGRYNEAMPLIEKYIENSLLVKDWTNVSLAFNIQADALYRQHQLQPAMRSWQLAFQYAKMAASIDNMYESTKGIADVYRKTGATDSAFFYYTLYNQFSDSIDRRLNQSQLSAMHARMAFDNLQQNLAKSQDALSRSRFITQVAIVCAILSAIILILLYNRYRLKSKYKLQNLQRKQEEAEHEVSNAKAQIAQFTHNLVEKNNLIESMQARLEQVEQHQAHKFTMEDLAKYTLVSEEEWVKFRVEFATAYPEFLNTLRKKLHQVTPAEERLSILMYLQLNNYQLAGTLGISKESVSRAKRRLRQRLNLAEDENLEDYLSNLLIRSQ